jgi:hypothetical protein
MNLNYVRAEAARDDSAEAQPDAVAVAARELIEQATYALDKPISQREHTDADSGAAARCLLAIEQGTGTMLLSERRKRAASHLHLDGVPSLTHHHEDRTTGNKASRESRLMDALGRALMEREAQFLRSNQARHSAGNDAYRDSPYLTIAHGAWNTSGELASQLKWCCDIFRPGPPDYEYYERCDYNSLELFGKLWKYLMIPRVGDPFLAVIGKPEEPLTKLFPNGDIAVLYYMSPFKRATLERLSDDIVVAPDIAPIPAVRELIETLAYLAPYVSV